jgi:hypothetical protein
LINDSGIVGEDVDDEGGGNDSGIVGEDDEGGRNATDDESMDDDGGDATDYGDPDYVHNDTDSSLCTSDEEGGFSPKPD